MAGKSGKSAPLGIVEIDYNRDVRPILAENCYTCHGPDRRKRKARLRLDPKEGALKNLKCPIGLRLRKADKVGNRIFIEGNSAAALSAAGEKRFIFSYPYVRRKPSTSLSAQASVFSIGSPCM